MNATRTRIINTEIEERHKNRKATYSSGLHWMLMHGESEGEYEIKSKQRQHNVFNTMSPLFNKDHACTGLMPKYRTNICNTPTKLDDFDEAEKKKKRKIEKCYG